MDQNLLKYRFGITLELEPSIYEFWTDSERPQCIKTVCQYFLEMLINQGYFLIPIKKNSYTIEFVSDIARLRQILSDYWLASNFVCRHIDV